jgi:alpha-tubulin suppressor-like RCC1 family protein
LHFRIINTTINPGLFLSIKQLNILTLEVFVNRVIGLFYCILLCSGFAGTYSVNAASVIGWGDESNEQTRVPDSLKNKSIRQIIAASWNSFILTADGFVYAWGDNTYGQCDVPESLSHVKAIASSFSHALALKEDSTVVGWGSNNYGETTIPDGLTQVIAIAAGDYVSMALL